MTYIKQYIILVFLPQSIMGRLSLVPGKLIIRFDDTNPSKEKDEYEESIIDDLESLGVKGDIVTHTSDYFDVIEKYAIQMIKEGKW